tara:strand:+ start:1810 stop:2127 length:318 start_codon:yes stop_codon:yes gene_type:complete
MNKFPLVDSYVLLTSSCLKPRAISLIGNIGAFPCFEHFNVKETIFSLSFVGFLFLIQYHMYLGNTPSDLKPSPMKIINVINELILINYDELIVQWKKLFPIDIIV